MGVTSWAFFDRYSGFYREPFVLARQLFDIFCHMENLDRPTPCPLHPRKRTFSILCSHAINRRRIIRRRA